MHTGRVRADEKAELYMRVMNYCSAWTSLGEAGLLGSLVEGRFRHEHKADLE